MKKYIVEFLGTFILVLTVLLSINSSLNDLAPVIIGAVLVIIIYIGGPISGAHYNPFVSIAYALNRNDGIKTFYYITIQLVASLCAIFISLYFFLDNTTIAILPSFNFLNGFIAEFIGTFALVWVILITAKIGARKGNTIYGLAIGSTVMICAFVFGGISGGAFNPAVTMSFIIAQMMSWNLIWIHLVAQLSGAICAAFVFKHFYLRPR